MIKKINRRILVAAIAAMLSLASTSCAANKGVENSGEIQKVELVSTSQSWDGVDLPDYPEGKPQLRVLKVVLPPHSSLAKHHHDVMSYGYVISGQLTLVRDSDGKETTVHAGEALVETVGTVHHGENRGNEPTELVVFYISKDGQPISVEDE